MSAAESQAVGLQIKQVETSVQVSLPLVPALEGIELHPQWTVLSRLPMRVSAGIPLPHFRVRNLLELQAGQLLESVWASTEDVPLTVGDTRLCWAEFDASEQRLAVRLTRLA